MTTGSLLPGARLGPYEIDSLIGAGAMGEVYKARDSRLNRTVAIKRVTVQRIERFAIEALAIAALNHPHICQIYDVGPDYLVLEYLNGESLSARILATEHRIYPEAIQRVLAGGWTVKNRRFVRSGD